MTTIRHPRRRPRVTSINWRSFTWVLTREAALTVLFSHSMNTTAAQRARQILARERTDNLRARVARRLGWRAARKES